MGTLRQLSYVATAALATGTLLLGCSGSDSDDMSAAAGPSGAPGPEPGPGTQVVNNADGPTGMGMMATEPPGSAAGGVAPGDTTTAEDTSIDPVASNCAPGIPPTSQVSRIRNREYDNIVRDLLGVTIVNGGAPSAMLNADYDGPIDTFTWNAYQDVGSRIAADVIAGADKANFISCDPEASTGCYEETIRAFGRKAFRRPLTEEEVTRFLALTSIEPAGTVDEIEEALLYAFLVSPSFLMWPEMGGSMDAAAAGIPLDDYQLAARLASLIWGSVPDDALNAAADAGELQDPAQLLAHADRMLQDRAKAANQVSDAHRAYLVMDDLSHWFKIDHPTETFANYSNDYKATLQAELDAFFEEIAFSNGSFEDIFLSNVGYVNDQTAALYGLNPADYGPELTKVELTDRPGFLTRAGFLSSFSSPEQTSPILRGAFITVNVLGTNPGAPDPLAKSTPIPAGNYSTRREQIEALTAPDECAGCHARLVNPPGYVLESFNAVGESQTVDSLGGEINSTADVIFSATDTKTISSAQEMMQEIANTGKARRIYVERLVAYATGRLPNENDACTVDALTTSLSAGNYTVLDILRDLTQADSFRLRAVGD